VASCVQPPVARPLRALQQTSGHLRRKPVKFQDLEGLCAGVALR